MNGLILINKPKGPTSAQVTAWVKNILNTKAGHCGTLDPNVGGILPILLGKGVKLLEYLQRHDKEYVCLMKTGKKIEEEKFKKILKEFIGKIYQTPPLHAAVAKKLRVRKIYDIEFLESEDNFFLFKIRCQHGTYVRKLVEDIGHVLGVKTSMEGLRRTKVGSFLEEKSCSLTKLKDAAELFKQGKTKYLKEIILPLEEAVKDMPKAYVKPTAVKSVCNGSDLMAPGLEKIEGKFEKKTVIALFGKEKLIGLGKTLFNSKEIIKQKKGVIIDLEKVVAEKAGMAER